MITILALLPLVLAAPVQDPADKPDKRPEVADLVKRLKEHAGREGKEDRDAVGVIDLLNQEFGNSGPKDRESIVKGLSRCFEERRVQRGEEAPDNMLYMAAAVALGGMGPESVKPLISWIGHKNHRKDLALQSRLILSLGKTRDKDAVKTLTSSLNDKTPSLVSAAAEALGEFAGAELELRKSIFESLLKTLMSAQGAKDADVNDNIARERYDVVAAPIITSLSKLSKHDERVPNNWLTWWNKNKRLDWDADQ